jgi:hypothetical protein
MAVAVVQVGIMRVHVPQRLMAMQVRMGPCHRIVMLMRVMAVMYVAMIMFDLLVDMVVLVVF